jgi:hypothetical protein
LSKPGQIGKIEGVNEVLAMPEVLDVFPSYKEGDIIPETAVGTLQQVILRIFAAAKSKKELAAVMNKIHETISVTSTNNENLLWRNLISGSFTMDMKSNISTVMITGAGWIF